MNRWLVLSVGVLAVSVAHAIPETYTRDGSLNAADSQLGASVAGFDFIYNQVVDDDITYLAAAAPGENTVYVYSSATGPFLETQRLYNAATGFGTAVAMDDQTLVISALDPATGLGQIYISDYDYTTGLWSTPALLPTPSIQQANADCGAAVAVASWTLAVGCPGYDDGTGADHGAVVAYEKQGGVTWVESIVLTDNNGKVPGERFGEVLFIEGGLVNVGVPRADSDQGYVQIWEFTAAFPGPGGTWAHFQTLVNPTPEAGERCGSAVDTEGDYMAIGCPDRSGGGAAMAWLRPGATPWQFDALLPAPPDAYGRFGASVNTLDEDKILVGAPKRYATGGIQGGGAATYVHDGSTWNHVYTLEATTPVGSGALGTGTLVTMQGATLGGPGYQANGLDSGELYFYEGAFDDTCPTDVDKFAPGTCSCDYRDIDIDQSGSIDACVSDTAVMDSESLSLLDGAWVGPGATVARAALISGTVGAGATVGRNATVAGTLAPGVVVGRAANVSSGAYVEGGSLLGYGAVVGTGGTLGPQTTLGNLVGVGANVHIGDDGYGGGVVIGGQSTVGDTTSIGSGTRINNGADIGANVTIGRNVKILTGADIDDNAIIGDNVRVGRDVFIADGSEIAMGVILKAGAQVPLGKCVLDIGAVIERNETVTTDCP